MGQGSSSEVASLLDNEEGDFTQNSSDSRIEEVDRLTPPVTLLPLPPTSEGGSVVGITDVDVANIDEGEACASDGVAPIVITGHVGAVNHCAVSPDTQWVGTAGADGTARIWKINGATLNVLRGHEGEVRSCGAFPDSQRIVTTGHDGTARVWNAYTGNCLHMLCGHEGPVFSCAVFPSGRQVITTGSDCNACIWELEGSAILRTFQGPEDPRDRREPFGYTPAGQKTDSVVGAGPCCCAVSPNGDLVALAGGDDGSFVVAVWDVATGDQVCELGDRCCYGCAFFPDGQRLVSFGEEFQVHDCSVWDISSEEELCSLRGHHYINGGAVFPSGDYAVAVGDDGLARVFRVTRVAPDGSAQYCVFDCGNEPVRGCAIFPDGSHVVSTSSDGTVRIWTMP